MRCSSVPRLEVRRQVMQLSVRGQQCPDQAFARIPTGAREVEQVRPSVQIQRVDLSPPASEPARRRCARGCSSAPIGAHAAGAIAEPSQLFLGSAARRFRLSSDSPHEASEAKPSPVVALRESATTTVCWRRLAESREPGARVHCARAGTAQESPRRFDGRARYAHAAYRHPSC